eukprot:Pgem_evm1s12572
MCFGGGSLVCCDRCPAAVCTDCCEENKIETENDKWICQGCEKGKFVTAGEIIWAKL